MTQMDLGKASNPDLPASLAAMRRAARAARLLAVQTDTAIVLVKNGRPVRIHAALLRESAASLAEVLAAMPDAGTDEDFARTSR